MNKFLYDSMTPVEKALCDLMLEINRKLDMIIHETESAEVNNGETK